jgi:transcriptional regulator with XRE-family HTH domain
MANTDPLLAALKPLLKARGITYKALGRELGLSEPSIKRMLAGRTMTLARLNRILEVLGTDLFELARIAQRERTLARELTLAQEEALAKDARLLTVFHLLLNQWTVPEISVHFSLAPAELVRLLARLARLELIDLAPGNQVRLKVARNLQWRRGGPVRRAYEAKVLQEFLLDGLGASDMHLRFEVREVSRASLALLQRKLDKLAVEFNETAELETTLPRRERLSVGIALICRPWTFSAAAALRRS